MCVYVDVGAWVWQGVGRSLGLWGGRAMSEKDTAPDLWVMLGFVVIVGVVAFGFGRAGSQSSPVPASRPMTYGEASRLIVPSKKRQRSTGFSQPARPSRPVNRYGGAVQVHYA